MKIGLLTSSRADFGIYFPLAKKMKNDAFFDLNIIAFGTHLDENYGFTLNEIESLGFNVKYKIKTSTVNTTALDISKSIAKTQDIFANFWHQNAFDLVLALGDRYEMFAAVSASTPFNVKIAHIHAGETTLGAIDNAYRHSISHMSKFLFVTNSYYGERALNLVGNEKKEVFNVGALSIDNLIHQELFSKKEFLEKFKIDLNIPSILSTFHPETVSLNKNEFYIKEIIKVFKKLKSKYQIIITMPNSDTMGNVIRKHLKEFGKNNENVHLIESFGMKGYLSCMKECSMLLGNTSSGFVEASFFPKWVINLGNRQEGRLITKNILNTKIVEDTILETVNFIENNKLPLSEKNIYGKGNAADNIIKELKQLK